MRKSEWRHLWSILFICHLSNLNHESCQHGTQKTPPQIGAEEWLRTFPKKFEGERRSFLNSHGRVQKNQRRARKSKKFNEFKVI
jgi:hypothetical protein